MIKSPDKELGNVAGAAVKAALVQCRINPLDTLALRDIIVNRGRVPPVMLAAAVGCMQSTCSNYLSRWPHLDAADMVADAMNPSQQQALLMRFREANKELQGRAEVPADEKKMFACYLNMLQGCVDGIGVNPLLLEDLYLQCAELNAGQHFHKQLPSILEQIGGAAAVSTLDLSWLVDRPYCPICESRFEAWLRHLADRHIPA